MENSQSNLDARKKGSSIDEILRREGAYNIFERGGIATKEAMNKLALKFTHQIKALKQEVRLALQTEVRFSLPSREKVTKFALPAAAIALTLVTFAGKAQATIEGPEDKAVAEEIKRGRMLVDGLKKDVEKIQEQYRDQQAQLAGQSTQPPAPAAEAPLRESNNNPQPPTAIPVPASVEAEENKLIQSSSNPEVDGTAQQNAVTQQITQEENRVIEQNSTQAPQTQSPEVTRTQVSANLTGNMTKAEHQRLSSQFLEQNLQPSNSARVAQPTLLQQIRGEQNARMEAGTRIKKNPDGSQSMEVKLPVGAVMSDKSIGVDRSPLTNFEVIGITESGVKVVRSKDNPNDIAFLVEKGGKQIFKAVRVEGTVKAQGDMTDEYTFVGSENSQLPDGLNGAEALLKTKIPGTDITYAEYIISLKNNPTTASSNLNIKNDSVTLPIVNKIYSNVPKSERLPWVQLLATVNSNYTQILRLPESHPLRILHGVTTDLKRVAGDDFFVKGWTNDNLNKVLNAQKENTAEATQNEVRRGLAESIVNEYQGLLKSGVQHFPNQIKIIQIQNALNSADPVQALSQFSIDELNKAYGQLRGNAGIRDSQVFSASQRADNMLNKQEIAQRKSDYLFALQKEAQVKNHILVLDIQNGLAVGIKSLTDPDGKPMDPGVLINQASTSVSGSFDFAKLLITGILGNPTASGSIERVDTSKNISVIPGVTQEQIDIIKKVTEQFGKKEIIDGTGPRFLYDLAKLVATYRNVIPGGLDGIPVGGFRDEASKTSWVSDWYNTQVEGDRFGAANVIGQMAGIAEVIEKIQNDPKAKEAAFLLDDPNFIKAYQEHIATAQSPRSFTYKMNGVTVSADQIQQALAMQSLLLQYKVRLNPGQAVSSVPGINSVEVGAIDFVGIQLSDGGNINEDQIRQIYGYKNLTQTGKDAIDSNIKKLRQEINNLRNTLPGGRLPSDLRTNEFVSKGIKPGNELSQVENAFQKLRNRSGTETIKTSKGEVTLRSGTAKDFRLDNVLVGQYFRGGTELATLSSDVRLVEITYADGTKRMKVSACDGNDVLMAFDLRWQDGVAYDITAFAQQAPNKAKNTFAPMFNTNVANVAGLQEISNQRRAEAYIRTGQVIEDALSKTTPRLHAALDEALKANMSVDQFKSLLNSRVVNYDQATLDSYILMQKGKQDVANGDLLTQEATNYRAFQNMKTRAVQMSLEDQRQTRSKLNIDFGLGGLLSPKTSTEVRSISGDKAPQLLRTYSQGNQTFYEYKIFEGGQESITTRTSPFNIGIMAEGSDKSDTFTTIFDQVGYNNDGIARKQGRIIGQGQRSEAEGFLSIGKGFEGRSQRSQTNERYRTETRAVDNEQLSDFQPGGKVFRPPAPAGKTLPLTPGTNPQQPAPGPDPLAMPTPGSANQQVVPTGPNGVNQAPGSSLTNPSPSSINPDLTPSTPLQSAPSSQIPTTGPILPSAPAPTPTQLPTPPIASPTSSPTPEFSNSFGLGGKSGASAPTINGNSSNLFNR